MNTQQKEIRENIIELFNIKELPEEKQEETINRIGGIIFQSVLMRVLPMLSEEELADYEKLLDNNVAPDELMNFFGEKVPNFLDIIAEESENFKTEAAEVFKKE
jgi:hypothetical protein